MVHLRVIGEKRREKGETAPRLDDAIDRESRRALIIIIIIFYRDDYHRVHPFTLK